MSEEKQPELLPHSRGIAKVMLKCACCQESFPIQVTRIDDPNRQRFCSKSCANRVKPKRGKAKSNSGK